MNTRTFSPDPRWAMRCRGYHIQARPDRTTVEAIVALQHTVLAASPIRLHFIPPDALHVSVVTLLPADHSVQKVEEAWTWLSAHFTNDLRGLVELGTPLPLTFPRLAFTPQAVIISTSEQPHPIDALRKTYGRLLGSLGLPVSQYDQTHVTLARYAEERSVSTEELASTQEAYLGINGRFAMIRFVRERCYPSLTSDIL